MSKIGAAEDASSARPRSPARSTGAATLRAGDTIADKYSIVRQIGEGGMAVVYEALHLRLRQRLAIKVLRRDVREFDDVLARFEREARATAQLRSIHTARVVDVDTLADGVPYIVMEYLEGEDLDSALQSTGPFSIEGAVDIVLQVTEAMAEAHALGIVHRDLKPSNLFVCRLGDRQLVKVLDFGISKSPEEDGGDSKLTQAGEYFGTPCYAAPEQLRSAVDADVRSDIWSLGIILYELLTGQPPFIGNSVSVIARVMSDPIPSPVERRPDLPLPLARVVMQTLKRDPSERFQTMREFGEALAPFGPAQKAAAVAEAQRPRGRLGEILVAEGMLTAVDLQRALDELRRSGKLLGRVLLDLGLVAHADLLTALAKQQGIASTASAHRRDTERRARRATTVAPRRTRRWAVLAIALTLVALGLLGAVLAPSGARGPPQTATPRPVSSGPSAAPSR